MSEVARERLSDEAVARVEILNAWEKHLENHPCGPCYEYIDDLRQAQREDAAENERLRELLHRVQRRAREELGLDV